MIFNLFESLSTEEYLESDLLQKQLADKFGRDFYEKPICREVCEYVIELAQNNAVKFYTASVYKEIVNDDKTTNYEPVSNKGHFVVLFNNVVYDYTGDQYQSYGFSRVGGLRMLNRARIDHELFSNVQSYKLDDYIICI